MDFPNILLGFLIATLIWKLIIPWITYTLKERKIHKQIQDNLNKLYCPSKIQSLNKLCEKILAKPEK